MAEWGYRELYLRWQKLSKFETFDILCSIRAKYSHHSAVCHSWARQWKRTGFFCHCVTQPLLERKKIQKQIQQQKVDKYVPGHRSAALFFLSDFVSMLHASTNCNSALKAFCPLPLLHFPFCYPSTKDKSVESQSAFDNIWRACVCRVEDSNWSWGANPTLLCAFRLCVNISWHLNFFSQAPVNSKIPFSAEV